MNVLQDTTLPKRYILVLKVLRRDQMHIPVLKRLQHVQQVETIAGNVDLLILFQDPLIQMQHVGIAHPILTI